MFLFQLKAEIDDKHCEIETNVIESKQKSILLF